jgi:hypothetical protein
VNSETSQGDSLPRRHPFFDQSLLGLNALKRHQPLASLCLNRQLKALVLLVALLSIQGCGRPPQVVDDEECFSAVESLWTAVTTKRTDLLEQSATEIDRLHATGKLSEEGHEALDKIIQSARDEEWMPAAKSLKAFMLGQRKTAD